MKRVLFGILALALAAGLLLPSPAAAQNYFWWQAVDEAGQNYTGETVQCSVYRANVHAAAVLHTTSAMDAGMPQPIWSDTLGRLHFFSTLATPVDVTCQYTYGSAGFSGRMTRFDHKIVLPRQGGQIVRFGVNSTAATYQTDSGIVLPQGALIRDVIIQNLNPQGLGTYHLSIGFLGNHTAATAAALVHTQALSSPDEWLRPHVQYSFTQQILGVAANHRGLVLSDFALRHSEGAGSRGWYVERSYLVHVATGLGVGYSAQPGTGAGLRAHVYILFDRLHTIQNIVPFGAGR